MNDSQNDHSDENIKVTMYCFIYGAVSRLFDS